MLPPELSPPPGCDGLTSDEVKQRLARYGPNEVATTQQRWFLRTVLALVSNPLVLILLAASVVSGMLGEALNASIITLMVLLSLTLDFFQIYRSEQAARKLQHLIAPTATVWRDGAPRQIPVRDIVPGDLVILRAGDLIPADGKLVRAISLTVDEAALTGESLPVEKRAEAPPLNQVYAGTSVISGVGQAVVVATGGRTQFGAIARALVERAPPSAFETGIRQFGLLITRTVIGLVVFVFFVNALLHRDPLESFLFALALAVGLTPEFLPMIITVTLGQGALRMARGKVIVKRLAAIENLGSMDVLCSDKTGTLTQGTVSVQEHVDFAGRPSEAALRWACINSALQSGTPNPLDIAITAHKHPSIEHYVKRAELPFDFERRLVSVLAAGPDGVHIVAKGAPEAILPRCDQVEDGGRIDQLSENVRATAEQTYARLSQQGYRVLAVARRPAASEQVSLELADEQDFTLVGFIALLDPPNPSARQTIKRLREHGVRVKVLTGDGELVTRTICQRVGIPTEQVVRGDELQRMTDDALFGVVERADVFVRVTPAQKSRILRALRRRGHVVGYVGDGINDAPSLHAADVGISVANAVDVAKAAADIILLEKSLAAIHHGVVEGRKSFGNITKYVLMGTSSNFGNMLSTAAAAAFLPFLPLLPAQILLNNFLYDLAQLTIPSDNVDPSYIAKPRRWDTALVQRFMLGLGPISSLYDFLTFAILLGVFHASPELFRSGWFVESLATQTLVIFVVRTAEHPLRSRPSRALVLSIAASVSMGVAVVMSPIGASLGFTPLPPVFFAVLVALTTTYLAMVEIVKRRFFRAGGW